MIVQKAGALCMAALLHLPQTGQEEPSWKKTETPSDFLKEIAAQDGPKKGRLKIFFGYSAGVGKTYAMLTAAHRAQKYGVDVVAGYVERHQRPETLALLDGLEQLPCRELEYKGLNLREFDLDGALARRPRLILVDELAHTNAPGSRHTKRYQDVEEAAAGGDQCLYHSKRAAPGISERSCHLHHRDRGERTDPGSRV